MRWIPDPTGRLPLRPHYEKAELDRLCEARIDAFLRAKHGRIHYPIDTYDLTILLEQVTDDFDLFADLSSVAATGVRVEGVTTFYRDRRPRVLIARTLSEDPRREVRLRTTLTHELGHVTLHDFVGPGAQPHQLPLFDAPGRAMAPQHCTPDTGLSAGATDWMEWQAGYCCGAFLMPATAVRGVMRAVHGGMDPSLAARPDGQWGAHLIDGVRDEFGVSTLAARVRLTQLGYLIDEPARPSLPRVSHHH